MNLQKLVSKAQKFVTDNSPAILAAAAVTGTITTAYLTGKASFKAAKILEDEQFARNIRRQAGDKVEELDRKHKFRLLWKIYMPAVTTGILTSACIVGSNRISTRRSLAVATAYTSLDAAFGEYRAKVIEKIGENKEQAVRDEVAQERVGRMEIDESKLVVVDSSDVLCEDAYSNRYFMCSMEKLRKAENDINFKILNDDYARITDFYHAVGLPPTSVSDEMGWNTDKKLTLLFSSTLTKDNKPCLSFDFGTVPIRDPWHFC